jgi:hypothetical protein
VAIDFDHLAPDLTGKFDELTAGVGGVDEKITQAINDANALPITNDRFNEDSLTIWPFVQNTIPAGALAPGAVGSDDIADFTLVARKFKDDRHRLY